MTEPRTLGSTKRGLAKRFGELGLLGMHLEGYGGAGMSSVDDGLARRDGRPRAGPGAG